MKESFLHYSLSVIDERQVNLKGHAYSLFAVNPDIAARLFDDAVNGRQSHSRCFADYFSGENRLEDVIQRDKRIIFSYSIIKNRRTRDEYFSYSSLVLYLSSCPFTGLSKVRKRRAGQLSPNCGGYTT